MKKDLFNQGCLAHYADKFAEELVDNNIPLDVSQVVKEIPEIYTIQPIAIMVAWNIAIDKNILPLKHKFPAKIRQSINETKELLHSTNMKVEFDWTYNKFAMSRVIRYKTKNKHFDVMWLEQYNQTPSEIAKKIFNGLTEINLDNVFGEANTNSVEASELSSLPVSTIDLYECLQKASDKAGIKGPSYDFSRLPLLQMANCCNSELFRRVFLFRNMYRPEATNEKFVKIAMQERRERLRKKEEEKEKLEETIQQNKIEKQRFLPFDEA